MTSSVPVPPTNSAAPARKTRASRRATPVDPEQAKAELEAQRFKRTLAQYYTVKSPFDHPLFQEWAKQIPNLSTQTLLEPFAGSNHIPAALSALGWSNPWECFDLSPGLARENALPAYKVRRRDTLARFPKGFTVAVTNPPWLAKNSAKRRGLPYPADAQEDDLYKVALRAVLGSVEYAAVVLPESFLTQGLWHNRLFGVISLTHTLFDDTEHPTCLGLFVPKGTGDFDVWRGLARVGSYGTLAQRAPASRPHAWVFNEPKGSVGIRCVDNTQAASITFVPGEQIDAASIKHTSRSLTRIGGLPEGIDRAAFLARCQALLDQWRLTTQDTMLTAFKGLRADGLHRRRLDFANARRLMDQALNEML